MEKETTTEAGTQGQQGAAAQSGAEKIPSAAKTYDQAYIDALLEKQKQAQEAAVAEAVKVAGMDKDSKEAYRRQQEEKAREQREADLARRELRLDAREALEQAQVPAEFLDMLLGKDLKETRANAEAFKAKFDAAVQAQVEKRLVGKTPQGGNGAVVSEAEAMAAEIAKYM